MDVRLIALLVQNIRYYGELAKFKVAQPHTILHVLKMCLDDFTGSNVDNVANLLESCGRFLLRNEETSERAKAMVSLTVSDLHEGLTMFFPLTG